MWQNRKRLRAGHPQAAAGEAAPRGLAAADRAAAAAAVRLIEELGLRTQRLQPLLEKLQQISRRMDDPSQLPSSDG